MKLDDIDIAILDALSANGRATSAEIGEQVGLSPSAAHRRVKALEDAGVIAGYAARIAPDAFGPTTTAFVAVTLENQRQETMAAFERAVARHREIEDCHLMTGESDYLLRILVRSDDRYERVHQDVLSRLPGVRRLVTSFSIRTVFRRS
ncbi:MAG: Lrp/AsnC family transcriptional regulator [Alphaproteobacteria bacterium]|nr:Lrp/AsnC family transcriptional regulator [Alphaproteobacteria bacterium]